MQTTKTRLSRLENKVAPETRPRLIVLNPGEEKAEALARLKIVRQTLDLERQRGRQVIWVKWAG